MANYKLLELRFEHPSNARLDLLTREIWTGLNLVVADVQGRLLDNPALILARLFPYEYGQITTNMIEASLVCLAAQNWLMRYEIAGMHLIQILQWWEGNSIQYAYPSKYPAPLGWEDRMKYNRRSEKFTENWNGHRDLTPRIGQPFTPKETNKVEALPRPSSKTNKVEALPKDRESESESEEESESESEGEEEESARLAQTGDAGPASSTSTSPAAPTAFSEEQTNPLDAQAALPNPADPVLVPSRENKGSKPVGLSGYTKLPETPAQAMDDPIIGIFSEVTGRIPGVAQYKTVIETILYIRKNIAGSGKLLSVVDYLKPYWLAWSGRKSQTGKPYNPSNITWLTEWAINASIPPIGGEKPADNLPRPPSVEETKKRLEQEAQATYTPPSQEVLAQLKSLSAAMTKKR